MPFYDRFLRPLFFTRRFYLLAGGLIILFVLSFFMSWLYRVAQGITGFFVLLVLLDYFNLFAGRRMLQASRVLPERFSNGDMNKVILQFRNEYPFTLHLGVIDELPVQFQKRDFLVHLTVKGGEAASYEYFLRPVQRGEYLFYQIRVFVRSPLRLVVRRFSHGDEQMVKVLPSYLNLRQYEIMAHSSNLAEYGSRRIRKMGHSLEFEQIKEYVRGDDIRTINWKATARKGGELMVNTYTDERSQQVYCLIDKGRVMKMPFEGMTLLDYAINASLILSRVALLRQDKAGLLSFDHRAAQFLPADRKAGQMNQILELLYNQQTEFLDSDFERLYAMVRSRITQRSLLLLFTNFESLSGLQRQLPFIRSLARTHLLMVIFFENTELKQVSSRPAYDIEALYAKTIAEKFEYEKRLIVKELRQHGITTILSTPQNLTVDTVNKYLELKARQAI